MFSLTVLVKGISLARIWSGRPGSNRRRPAWEAGILPLNYSRSVIAVTAEIVTLCALFQNLPPVLNMQFQIGTELRIRAKTLWIEAYLCEEFRL